MFTAGAFIASPELRAYAANTVGSADIINNSIQSVDIKNGEVKTTDIGFAAVTNDKIALDTIDSFRIKDHSILRVDFAANAVGSSEIAADAVGASELAGVSKLIFAECSDSIPMLSPGAQGIAECTVFGAELRDSVIATKNLGKSCVVISDARVVANNNVGFQLRNVCPDDTTGGNILFSIIVFDR